MASLRDLGWFILRYGILIGGFVAFLVGVFFIFQGLIQQRELIEKESRISVWFLAQTEIEFLRFTESLKDFELAPGPDTAKVANERFEIFWSRLPPLLAGSQTADLRTIEGVVASARSMINVLEDLEPDMQRLTSLDSADLAGIAARLDELRGPVHDLVRRALLYESNEVGKARTRHNDLYLQLLGLFALTLVVGLVIFALLFRQIVKTQAAVSAKDIAANQAIAARNELELAINSISEGFIVYDQDDRVALFNKRYVDLHQQQADTLAVGVSFSDLLRAAVAKGGVKIPEGGVEAWIAGIVEQRNKTVDSTFESRKSDGHWLRISERRTIDGRLVGVHTDITELKEREQLVEQKSTLLQTTLDNMKQGIAVFDDDMSLLLFNNQYHLVNVYPDEILQPPARYQDLVAFAARRGDFGRGDPSALAKSQVTAIERLMESGTGSLRQQRKLNDGRVIETIATALPTGGFVKTYDDITERIASEIERTRLTEMYHAAQKTQALGTLAGGIAHDFNNIIGAVVGNCALLINDISPNDPAHERLKQIMDSGTRARDLVRQILTYSRNAESMRQPLDFGPAVQESLATIRPLLPRNVVLKAETIESCLVSGDTTQIHQVILNVCVNAAQAIGEREGRIFVSVQSVDITTSSQRRPDAENGLESWPSTPTRGRSGTLRDGRYARLTIIDTGCGIPQEVMPRIFEPFYTTKEVGQGTGLGLAAVQGIVRNHDGCVDIESLPDVGTRVDVYIPITEATPLAALPVSRELTAATNNERVLLVDDDRILLSVTKEILMRLGYVVDAHNEPEQALAAFRANPHGWDLAITDRSMPKMTGEDFTRALKKIRADLPVLMLSGFVSGEDAERLSGIGLEAVIGKPVLPEELAAAVHNVLCRPEADRNTADTTTAGA